MLLDIYKRTPIVTKSDEHILLNALGGRLASDRLIDKTTNDSFGSTIDAALAESLLPFRVLLGVQSGSGHPPRAIQGAMTADGEAYNLLPGGMPEIAKPRVQFQEIADGQYELKARVRSREELRRLAKRKLTQLGVSIDILDGAFPEHESHVPRLRVDFSFSPDTFRAIAKMVCNLLALKLPDVFAAKEFDPIRMFVLMGGDPWDFVAVNTEPTDVTSGPGALGPLDHLLLLRANENSGLVQGLVVLYGHLQFSVLLASGQIRQSFVTSYRVDQLGQRDQLDSVHDVTLFPSPFVPLKASSDIAWFDALNASFARIAPILSQKNFEGAVRQIVSDSAKAAFGLSDSVTATPEQIEEFGRQIEERVTRLRAHLKTLASSKRE